MNNTNIFYAQIFLKYDPLYNKKTIAIFISLFLSTCNYGFGDYAKKDNGT